MVSRQSLLALLGAGVSAFVLSSHPVLAATGRSFSPATNWSISRVEPPNGGAAYCTLARRFDGNTVITFARNTTGEGTVAVDFQQPLFDPNQTYRIALQAGQGLKREFMTRPATPNAVVLRTGQDAQFFNALAGSNELGVILDSTRYAFAIPDFADGTGQLTGCIGQAPSSMIKAPAPAAPESDAMAELRAQLNSLKAENANIAAAIKQGGSSADSVSDALPDTAENKQLADKLAKLEGEKSALVDKLQNERARQQQESQTEQDLQKALADQKALKDVLESERQQRATLEASLTQKAAEAEKRGELNARISALESSNAELKTLRETLDAEKDKRLAAEKALQDQKAASSSSLEAQELLRTRVSELEKQNKNLQQTAVQVEDMKTQLEDTGTRASMEQARREAAEKALQEMQMSSSQREAKLSEMQKQLASERSKMAEAETAEKAELTKKHADEIARLNTEIEKLHAQDKAAEEIKQKMVAEQARREAAEKALQDMQASASAREAKVADMRKQLELERVKMSEAEAAEKAELTKQHADEIARLNADIEKLRAEGVSAEDVKQQAATEQARREAAERELQQMREAADKQQAEISKKHADEVARLNSDIATLRAEGANAEEIKQKAVTEQARREAAEKQVQDMQAAATKQEAELARLRERDIAAQDIKQKAIAEQARREAAERELQQMQASTHERDGKISALQKQIEAEHAQMTSAENAKEVELAKQHADEVAKLNADIEKLRAAGNPNEDLALKATSEQARREATERELQQAREALEAKTSELSKASAEKADLLAQVDQVRAEAAKNRVAAGDSDKIKTMSDQLAQLETRNSDLMTQLQTAKTQTEAADKASVTTASNDAATNEKIVEIGRKAEADRRELQTLLEAEKARREKLEEIMAKGGNPDDRAKEMTAQMAELQKRNTDLEKRLDQEQARLAPAAGDGDNSEQVAALKKQLDILKGDNQMLAEKLSSGPKSAGDKAQVVYAGDEQMADALAESKSSLASVMAERDEYRGLLQRERANEKEGKSSKKDGKEDPGANARIAQLENERADLVKKLEYEKSRNEQIAAGQEPTQPSSGSSEAEINQQLENLKKQLKVAQQDVIDARQKALSDAAVDDKDVTALLAENKKLQTELAASAAGGSNVDARAMQTEIAALRAQNNVLSEEINKRLAAAPTRAAMDNAAAEANYKVKEAKVVAQQQVAGDVAQAQTRYQQAEAENIRLAKELAQTRMAAAQAPKQTMQPVMSPDQPMVTQVMPVPQAPRIVQAAPSPAAPAPSPMYTQASISPTPDVGPTGQDLAGYLKRAGIPMVSGFEKIRKISNPQFGAFRWDTGVVFGTAEQQKIPENQFEQAVNAYLLKTKQRCSGTFDQSFDPGQMSTHKNFAVADVACVMPDGTGAGAAMLFYYKDGMFNAIAHEGDVSQFDQAMSTRDTLSRFLKGII